MNRTNRLFSALIFVLAILVGSSVRIEARDSASGTYVKEATAICFLAKENNSSKKSYRIILTDFQKPTWNIAVQQSNGELIAKASLAITDMREMYNKKIIVVDGEGINQLTQEKIRVNFWFHLERIGISLDGVDADGKSKYFRGPSYFFVSRNEPSTLMVVTNKNPNMLPDLLSDDWKTLSSKQIIKLFGLIYDRLSE